MAAWIVEEAQYQLVFYQVSTLFHHFMELLFTLKGMANDFR